MCEHVIRESHAAQNRGQLQLRKRACMLAPAGVQITCYTQEVRLHMSSSLPSPCACIDALTVRGSSRAVAPSERKHTGAALPARRRPEAAGAAPGANAVATAQTYDVNQAKSTGKAELFQNQAARAWDFRGVTQFHFDLLPHCVNVNRCNVRSRQ